MTSDASQFCFPAFVIFCSSKIKKLNCKILGFRSPWTNTAQFEKKTAFLKVFKQSFFIFEFY